MVKQADLSLQTIADACFALCNTAFKQVLAC